MGRSCSGWIELRRRVAVPVAAMLVALSACSAPATSRGAESPGEDAPPRGKTLDEFYSSDRPSRPADTREADKMVLHVIDIGQGLALLVEFPCGAVLVDAGGELNDSFDSRRALGTFLDQFFARRPDLDRTLSALFITHPHIDHTRGIDVVLEKAQVDNVITNGQENEDLGGRPQLRLHRWVKKENRRRAKRGEPPVGFIGLTTAMIPERGLTNRVIDPIEGCEASGIDPQITALWGGVEDPKYSDNANDHSLVLKVEFGESSLLTSGDLELEGLDHLGRKYQRNQELLDVDVYVVGHHGSKNATAPHLMRSMTPKIAVISAGPYDRNHMWTARKYGHPNVKALNKLIDASYGVSWFREPKEVWVGVSGAWRDERKEVFRRESMNRAIYNTGWDGAIGVKMYGNGWLEVETAGRRPASAAAQN